MWRSCAVTAKRPGTMPPGTACPVVETMRGTDVVLMVTEPTPFGLHDLRLAVEVARGELGLPVGVVVNRDGVGDGGVDVYCAAEGIPILMRIPLDRRIAESLSQGQALVEALVLELEAVIVDAEQVQDRGIDLVDMDGIPDDVVAEVVVGLQRPAALEVDEVDPVRQHREMLLEALALVPLLHERVVVCHLELGCVPLAA